ncbi:AAA family ATPase [Brucella sp. 09RB8918]|nr:AAA family ATPase [Brucella sp. 09RB8913]MRN60270.1 AAA family ATPase [Brucella sp. 09RB8918]
MEQGEIGLHLRRRRNGSQGECNRSSNHTGGNGSNLAPQCGYLRAKKEWSPSWFMNELLENLRVTPPHSFAKKYAKALEELAMRQNSAMLDRRTFGLVIDEADHISSKSSILETIRDISDMIELPTVLVGMGKVADHLARFQFHTDRPVAGSNCRSGRFGAGNGGSRLPSMDAGAWRTGCTIGYRCCDQSAFRRVRCRT